MRDRYFTLNAAVFLVSVHASAAQRPPACNPCVDGPEMQQLAAPAEAPLNITPLTPAQIEARAPCLEASTQTEMTACQADLAKQASSRLEAALSAYRERLTSKQLSLFDASQTAWKAFRASVCEFQASGVDGGTAYSMVVSQCIETLTNDRLRAVEELAACEEGDLSCPAHR